MVTHLLAARFQLAEILEAKGITQTDLARRSGISQVTVNAIANNRTTRVDLATLDALAGVLGIGPGELIVADTPKPKRRKSA